MSRTIAPPAGVELGKPIGNVHYGCCGWTDRTLIGAGTFYLAAAGKLGCVLFQFPPWFTARRDNIDYRERLTSRAPWPIAIEFRGGGWMTDNHRARTLSLLEKLGAAYVVPDEPQGFRSSTPPPAANDPERSRNDDDPASAVVSSHRSGSRRSLDGRNVRDVAPRKLLRGFCQRPFPVRLNHYGSGSG